MRIVHLSDLHFGTETDDLQRDLLAHIREASPDFVIVSGDFTQVGNGLEFRKARAFLNSLPVPFLCVPGNHDIPRFNLAQRFLKPFAKYQRYITPDLSPVCEDENVCIAGINTARPILPHPNWANGAVSGQQLDFLRVYFNARPGKVKICVMHHPIHKTQARTLKTVVFGGGAALRTLVELKVDLVLTGHVHHASITKVENTTFLSASTALSSRTRTQRNGYNVVTIRGHEIDIQIYEYDGRNFQAQQYP